MRIVRAESEKALGAVREAIALYRALGFTPTGPYRHNPIEGAMFLELELR